MAEKYSKLKLKVAKKDEEITEYKKEILKYQE